MDAGVLHRHFLLRGIHGVFLRLPCGGGSLFFNGEAIAFERLADTVLRAAQTCSPFPLIVIRVLGHVLPDDFFCEKAGRRTAAAFGLWLFLPGGEGIGTDAVSGRHFAIGAIFEFCKDFFTDMGWIGHDFDGYCFFAI